MILEDLQHIFRWQIREGTDLLYFMLVDGGTKIIERHPVEDMATLLPMLSSFQYAGTQARVPRFAK